MSAFVSSVVDAFLLRHGFLHPQKPRAGQGREQAEGLAVKKKRVVHPSHTGVDSSAVASSSRAIPGPTHADLDIRVSSLAVDPLVCCVQYIGKTDSSVDKSE